jgi:hypothetical protein
MILSGHCESELNLKMAKDHSYKILPQKLPPKKGGVERIKIYTP